jgi:hypothetical protein
MRRRDVMGYMKIPNLYKTPWILDLPEVFVLEKIHGTSAHVQVGATPRLYVGGEKRENLEPVVADLLQPDLGGRNLVLFGEAFGGKQQKQAHRYGPKTRFVVFDVFDLDADCWLGVQEACFETTRRGLPFVRYHRIVPTVENLDAARDEDSHEAVVAGCGSHPMEGVVIRPVVEGLLDPYGNRMIAKHKRPEERETKTQRLTKGTPEEQEALRLAQYTAQRIAEEWTTATRLEHVIQKFEAALRANNFDVSLAESDTGGIIKAMLQDIQLEAGDEVTWTPQVSKAVGSITASLFRSWLRQGAEDARDRNTALEEEL